MSTKHSLVGVCAAVLLFVCFVTISRAYLVHRAKELITDVQGLDNARDPAAAALSFAKKYHRYLQETTCDHDVKHFEGDARLGCWSALGTGRKPRRVFSRKRCRDADSDARLPIGTRNACRPDSDSGCLSNHPSQ